MVEEDYIKRILLVQRLAHISEIGQSISVRYVIACFIIMQMRVCLRVCLRVCVDIESFCDPERPHFKEGIVTSEEEHGLHFNIRCHR